VRSTSTATTQKKETNMRVIDLFKDSNQVPVVPTKKATFESFSGPLEVEAGHERDDRTIRGCVRFVIDPDGGRGGGIATRIVRPGARRHGGAFHDEPKLMDVLEIHSLGTMETGALARALIFAGQQLLALSKDTEDESGVMRILGNGCGCVWEAK
jgi:hypothetical protein